jgi:3-hydroxyacyl-[acyl-carrier-protein] dehydratase
MLAHRSDIEKYIPQQAPFVMVHELDEANEVIAVTYFTVEEENVFVAEARLTEPGLIENMAQTAAAQVGYHCKQQGKPIPVGYIAAIKDLKIHSLPILGAKIRTQIEVVNFVLDVTIIKGIVFLNDAVLCECEMRIFVKK